MKKNGAKLSAVVLVFGLAALTAGLTGCAEKTGQEDELVITEQEKEKEKYNLVLAAIGDVVKTKSLTCTYQQTREQEVSFKVSGKRISKVHVEVGDNVKKGQLLAELVNDQMDNQIAELQYRIDRNKLLLSFVDENENNENSRNWLGVIYRKDMDDAKMEAFYKSQDAMHERYRLQREDYQDAIDLDTAELNRLLKEKAVGYVYAGMDGVISWEKQNLEGSTCTRDEVILKVIDSSDCVFVVKGAEYASLFQEGVPVELSLMGGTGAGTYRAVPYEMEKWDENLSFALLPEYGDSIIEVGATGTMRVVLEERKQVLSVPVGAVHKADEKTYVYVLGEGDVRAVRWVETGVFGDDRVEVKSGLEEGEKVIVR